MTLESNLFFVTPSIYSYISFIFNNNNTIKCKKIVSRLVCSYVYFLLIFPHGKTHTNKSYLHFFAASERSNYGDNFPSYLLYYLLRSLIFWRGCGKVKKTLLTSGVGNAWLHGKFPVGKSNEALETKLNHNNRNSIFLVYFQCSTLSSTKGLIANHSISFRRRKTIIKPQLLESVQQSCCHTHYFDIEHALDYCILFAHY